MNESAVTLESGVFTVSIDFELIWGTLDLFGAERFRRAVEFEREVAIDRLLDLFAEFNIPATWCVLGHLMLDGCGNAGGQSHDEIARPLHSWRQGDWFSDDPGGNEETSPLFFGRSLIRKIQACETEQEIGCHSFSHLIFGDQGCSREVAESDVAAAVEAARKMGIEMHSFAFPRNVVGHLDVLKDYRFVCYRGPERNWYESKPWPTLIKRLCHLWDVMIAATPDVVLPELTEHGLWNIPGSMIYFPMHGLRRYIPVSRRVRRAVKGLDAAAAEKRVFHLWFHPTNFADEPEAMFAGLRRILEHASFLRKRGLISILPMKGLTPAYSVQTAYAAR